jgi:hypothetical protein
MGEDGGGTWRLGQRVFTLDVTVDEYGMTDEAYVVRGRVLNFDASRVAVATEDGEILFRDDSLVFGDQERAYRECLWGGPAIEKRIGDD